MIASSPDDQTKLKIETLLRVDPRALAQMQAVRDVGPAGAYLAAGFVRNRVWDALCDSMPELPEADVDVVYFCKDDVSKERDIEYEAALRTKDPTTDWQVRNQARMHHFGGHAPFKSLGHALTHWAETATSVGVRMDAEDRINFVAPFGYKDLADHILRITPSMKSNDPKGFDMRLEKKGWQLRWPKLTVIR